MLMRWVARASALAVGASLLLAPNPASAADAQAFDGSTAYSAAGSCWEIKQRYPDKGDGRYWVVTPAMQAPMEIYCDQTTDGGGWTLVARGRERWTEAGGGTVGSGTWMTDLPIDGRNATMIAKQLPGDVIDALLNNTRVDSLSDGIRLRRAKNTSGTSWQELRYSYVKRDRWSWALSAKHAVDYYSVDGASTRATQESRDLRLNSSSNDTRMFNYATATNHFARGFNYAWDGPRGTTSSSSYLYSSRSDGRYATPFTQMYVRPKLLRSDMDFGGIPDSGLKAVTNNPLVNSQAEPNVWGVTGEGSGGKDDPYATEVSAFAQIGNVMYVGGNFTKVRNNVTGKEYNQSYLAAFDATTGAWISSFRPSLNNQVKALADFRGGLVVGGQFTRVNGATRRALVKLNPTTGSTDSVFKTNLSQKVSGAKLWVLSLQTSGPWLFVGGGFTSLSGGSSSKMYPLNNVARIYGTSGTPRYTWTPNLGLGLHQSNGKRTVRSSVMSLSLAPDGNTLYAAGQFTTGYVGPDGRNQVAARGSAAINVSTGTLRSWYPRYSTTAGPARYQQTIKAVGTKVWLGGSQHSMVRYNASNLAFERGNITLKGGDFQAIAAGNGVVYGSCHCDDFNYSDTMGYDNQGLAGSTQADRIGYIGAWDATTGDYLPQFAPTSGTRTGDGPWGLEIASDGTLWAGGDYTSVVTTNDKSEWAGGFVRFAPLDTTAPAAPKNLEARHTSGSDYAYFTWDKSTTSNASYELIKDNRVIQIMGPDDNYSDRENYKLATYSGRFFVRAVDAAGNRSATTPVVKIGGSAAAARQAPQQDTPAAETVLIDEGSAWAVTAPGSDDVDAAWASPDFEPSTAWPDAAAMIGWGTSRAASSFDDRPGTFYVRRDVTVDDPGALTTVTISTLADDGAAIYVNGVEVGRKNLPTGALTGASAATATPSDSDSLDWTISVPTSLLVKGRNVVAAEVHSASDTTRDVAFDLRMVAE